MCSEANLCVTRMVDAQGQPVTSTATDFTVTVLPK
jgi:hypothetical protein